MISQQLLLHIFAWLLASIGSTHSLPTLIYHWPFCHLTMAYELVNKREADYPKKGKCPLLQVGPPELGYNVFMFDGTDNTGARIKTSDTSLLSEVGIVFFVYPENDTGVIFDYVSKDQDAATISYWTIKLVRGNLLAVLRDGEENVVIQGRAGAKVPLQTWTMIAVSWGKDDGSITLQVNTNRRRTEGDDDVDGSFDSDGHVHISEPLDPSEARYNGRFCCLAIFSGRIQSSTGPAEILDIFKEPNWPSTAPSVKENCLVGEDSHSFLHLWPLSVESLGYDVVRNEPPLAPSYLQCSRSKTVYPATGRQVYYWDGSVFSYMSAQMSDQSVNEDITMAIMVRPDPPVEGVVFDYQASPAKTSGVQGLTLTLNTGHATLEMKDVNGVCTTVTNPEVIPANSWTLIGFVYAVTTDEVDLHVNTATSTVSVSCRHGSVTDTNGTILVGAAHDSTVYDAGYHGSAACLTVVNGRMDKSSLDSSVNQQCLSLDTGVSTPLATCEVPYGLPTAHFIKYADGKPPDVFLNTTNVFMARSAMECNTKCLQTRLCRSYAFSRTITANNCLCYDVVTKAGLVSDSDFNYYVVRQE